MEGTGQTGRDTRVVLRRHLLWRDGRRRGNGIGKEIYRHGHRYRLITRMDGMVRMVRLITRITTGAAEGMDRLEGVAVAAVVVVVWVGVSETANLRLILIFRVTTGRLLLVAGANRHGMRDHGMTDGAMIGMIGTMNGIGDVLIMTTGLGTAGRGVEVGRRLFVTGIGRGITAGEGPILFWHGVVERNCVCTISTEELGVWDNQGGWSKQAKGGRTPAQRTRSGFSLII